MLYGKSLARIEDAVRIGESLRTAAMGRAGRPLGLDARATTLRIDRCGLARGWRPTPMFRP